MSNSSRLPARPSLPQLHKQAKDLLRLYRSGDLGAVERLRAAGVKSSDAADSKTAGSRPMTLADAQLTLAREYGFANWAALKHHIQHHIGALRQAGLEQFERLAKDLAAAYTTGDDQAISKINWSLGTSFVRDRDPAKLHERLTTWFASEERTPQLAVADAQRMVAHAYGFDSWAEFAAGFGQSRKVHRSSRQSISRSAPFYTIDWDRQAMSVRGPQSDKDWDTILDVINEHELVRLDAGGMTEAGMDRITRATSITQLYIESSQLTDEAVGRLVRMPWLEELDIGGVNGQITDRGLQALSGLANLRQFKMCWQPNVSDAGVSLLTSCNQLEDVNLMGTPTGDGAIKALAGKPKLRRLKTGRSVTDAGLFLLHEIPVFKKWRGGEVQYGLMSFDTEPNHLLIDGPFTNAGLAGLAGLDGLFGLSFFWHCPAFTGAGLGALKALANLRMLGIEGTRCDDDAMVHIAALPGLRMLMAQGTVASDTGFAALSRSQSIEYIWGRECPNLTGRGFAAMASMPSLRGLAVSCKNVDDPALSMLPSFPALTDLLPMDVPDAGFRHIGLCDRLENLWCMYCRDTGDAATDHISGLSLKHYYAGQTRITDRSLGILGKMHSLEQVKLWACAGVTNAGIASLASLPRLREVTLDNLAGVTRDAIDLFPAHVRVSYLARISHG